MKWSFSICFNSSLHLKKQLDSIRNQDGLSVSNYQIVLIGPPLYEANQQVEANRNLGVDISLVPFDDTAENGWITRKKNLSVYMCKYDNLVITHDYIALCKDWYKNFVSYGDDWDVCMNPIRFPDGKRFRDWIKFKEVWGWPLYLPYEDESNTTNMYISGTYWCAKKQYMIKNPLNESLRWGQGEDLEWSHRCRHTWKYRMNKKSVVKMLKEKRWKGEMDYSPHPDTDPNSQDIELFSSEIQQ